MITSYSDSKKQLKTRTLLTSKHHRFGRFKPWESFYWLLLEVQRITNLGLFHILHSCYYVAHLACKPTEESWKEFMQSKQGLLEYQKNGDNANPNANPNVWMILKIITKDQHVCYLHSYRDRTEARC